MTNLQKISNYLQQNTRNRIVFCRDAIDGICFINLGHEYASLLNRDCSNYLDALRELLSSSTQISDSIGRYLALENIGILFEPELKIDIRNLFDSYSKNQCLIIKSDAGITSDTFYWLSESDGVHINLNGLSYKQI